MKVSKGQSQPEIVAAARRPSVPGFDCDSYYMSSTSPGSIHVLSRPHFLRGSEHVFAVGVQPIWSRFGGLAPSVKMVKQGSMSGLF